jgi:predicted GIY-YIG superfamily endonuclease
MFHVYAISSHVTGRTYIGQTENIKTRIASHNDGQVRSTKKDRPWDLIAIEEFETREAALEGTRIKEVPRKANTLD